MNTLSNYVFFGSLPIKIIEINQLSAKTIELLIFFSNLNKNRYVHPRRVKWHTWCGQNGIPNSLWKSVDYMQSSHVKRFAFFGRSAHDAWAHLLQLKHFRAKTLFCFSACLLRVDCGTLNTLEANSQPI